MTTHTLVWAGWPHAPAPVAAIVRARRRAAVQVVDDLGRPVRVGPVRLCYEVVRHAVQRASDLLLRGLAAAVAGRRAPAPDRAPVAAGAVVLVVPVLPDISHTFVYREVLAILRARPAWRCVVLRHNPTAPRHGEAAALAARAAFLPRGGVLARTLRVLRWLLRRRGRELFALYRAADDGGVAALLGKQVLRDPCAPGNAFELAEWLRPLRPGHLHVYASTWPTNVVMGAAHLLAVPFSISSYVDFDFPYAHKMLACKVARAAFLRVVTRDCRARLRALPGLPALDDARLPVVYLGLDLANWQQHAVPPGRGVLVSAARLVPKKGLHLVPAALRLLREQGIACRWRLIGDGPERAAIAAACREHDVESMVDWLGALDSAAVRRELLAADLAVLPCLVASDGERDGIPVFLTEAMALGVPVVTTPVAGIPELVVDGDTGWLAPVGDSAGLAAVLAAALRDPVRAAAIGARGRARVHRDLDVDRSAGQLIARIEAPA